MSRATKDILLALQTKGYLLAQSVAVAREPKEWIQIMPAGTWEHYWGFNDDPLVITEQNLEEMVTNFKRYGLDVLIDVEHESVWGNTKAAGWMRELRITGGVLEARVDWTPTTLQMLKDEEYKFFSPAWQFDAKDDKTAEKIGSRLFSGGLTNTPYFEVGLDQQLLAKKLHLANKAGETTMEFLKKIAVMLGMAETATEEEVTAKVQGLVDELKTLKEGQTTASKNAPVIAATQKIVDAVRNELRLASTATDAEFVAAIKGRGADDEQTASRLATLEAASRKDKATALVASLQREGKLVAADLPWANEQAEANPEGFAKLMAAAPIKVTPGKGGELPAGNHNPEQTVTATDAQTQIAQKLGTDPAKTAAKADKLLNR